MVVRFKPVSLRSGTWSVRVNIVSANLSLVSAVVHVCTALISVSFYTNILHVFWGFSLDKCIYRFMCTCECECECVRVCIESSAAPGKGMPAKWQMVGINLAKSLSPSMRTPPTWLPTLPRVYFPPRTRCAHYLLRRISLLTSKISCEIALHQVQATPLTPCTLGYATLLCLLVLTGSGMHDAAFLRGNTTIWKQTSSKNKTLWCLWR